MSGLMAPPASPLPRRATTTDNDWMRMVLEKCEDAVAHGEAPFAAAVVRDGELLSIEHNLTRSTKDPTTQAEVLAIRSAAEKLGSDDLTGATLYSSCEPSLMGFGAVHFARISRIVYGATIGDAALAGFEQLPIFASQLKLMGRSPVEIVAELMREQCVEVLAGARK
jgi:guanine deaminase